MEFLVSDSDLARMYREDAARWEVVARRATDGARSASKGAERLQRRVASLRDTVKILTGRIERLTHENAEQQKKISRLSLKLLAALGPRHGETEE